MPYVTGDRVWRFYSFREGVPRRKIGEQIVVLE